MQRRIMFFAPVDQFYESVETALLDHVPKGGLMRPPVEQ